MPLCVQFAGRTESHFLPRALPSVPAFASPPEAARASSDPRPAPPAGRLKWAQVKDALNDSHLVACEISQIRRGRSWSRNCSAAGAGLPTLAGRSPAGLVSWEPSALDIRCYARQQRCKSFCAPYALLLTLRSSRSSPSLRSDSTNRSFISAMARLVTAMVVAAVVIASAPCLAWAAAFGGAVHLRSERSASKLVPQRSAACLILFVFADATAPFIPAAAVDAAAVAVAGAGRRLQQASTCASQCQGQLKIPVCDGRRSWDNLCLAECAKAKVRQDLPRPQIRLGEVAHSPL